MERKELIFKATKVYIESGETYRITATACLSDECKNGRCDFVVTADIDRKANNGRWVDYAGGCCHEEIAKRFKNLQPIINLHLCNNLGQPMYPIENGMYFLKKEDKNTAMKYLRITDNEYNELKAIVAINDKEYFRYSLYALGISKRWEDEAKAAIALLEELTGGTWVNPYPGNPKAMQPLSGEELESIKGKIAAGYYTPAAIKERAEKMEAEKMEAEKAKILERYNKKATELSQDRDIDLYVLEKLGTKGLENKIYYNHTNKLVFNWLDYKDKITQEEFIDFINTVDYSSLPEGIQFEIK